MIEHNVLKYMKRLALKLKGTVTRIFLFIGALLGGLATGLFSKIHEMAALKPKGTISRIFLFIGALLGGLAIGLFLIQWKTSPPAPSTTTSCDVLIGKTPTPSTAAGAPATPSATASVTSSVPTPTEVPPPAIYVGVRYPDNMNTGGSDIITVSLTRHFNVVPKPTGVAIKGSPPMIGGQECILPTVKSGHQVLATPFPVGTQTKPIQLAFGRGYSTSASAEVDAVQFTKEPVRVPSESLDEPQAEWFWTITPKDSGKQAISVYVDVQWSATAKKKQPLTGFTRRIWQSDPLYVDVHQPTFVLGQLNILALTGGVIAALGSALAVWIFHD